MLLRIGQEGPEFSLETKKLSELGTLETESKAIALTETSKN